MEFGENRSGERNRGGHAFFGEKDLAILDLERSSEAREGQIFYIKYDPVFDGIRGEPGFRALEKRVGLE